MAHITREQWEAKGAELFGPEQDKWRFACPVCGNEMSIERARADFAEHLPKLRAGKYSIEGECIGRHVAGVGCDWTAYGLLSGPVFVGEKRTPVFDFAGHPFTRSQPAIAEGRS